MDKNAKTVPLTKGPTDSGGGPSITGKETGKLEPGMKIDYEDMCFDKPEEDITNEDLSSWLFEYWGNLDSSVGKLATVVEKMCTFSLATRNLHKEMKGWCIELHKQMGRVQKRSEALKSFVDKSSDRIVDLSSSLLEVSTTHSLRAVSAVDIGVGTETEAVLKPRSSDEQDTGQQTSSKTGTNQGHGRQRRHLKTTNEKKKKTKMKTTDDPKNIRSETKSGNQKEEKRTSKRKKKTETILIKSSEVSSYADITRKLKGNIDVNTLKVDIKTMKKTERGDLILQIDRGPKQAEAAERLKTAIVEVLGEEAVVEYKPKSATVEIKDLETETSEDEVKNAVVKATDVAPNSIKLLPSFGGTKMAVVRLRDREAIELGRIGRLTVGLVRCRVKLRQQIVRCFRCHDFGHIRAKCSGADRSNLCMTCGDGDHEAKSCSSPPRCVLCKDNGHDGSHYPGSGRCKAAQEAKKKT
ncbi:unnamed protein product [Macrosiphum euphorbiae]|uniref:CCHC-type domain-containing protein n=1 Tax=Macrosiphum euphorbiae TaxID=13131 RepID=A0AAV0WID0_9HEMI|nr:unnamed protein product [Macrosiphum euphorbiae]